MRRRFGLDVHASVDPKNAGYPNPVSLLLIIGGMNGNDEVPHVQTLPDFPQNFACMKFWTQ